MFCGGGSGGHLFPALAVVEELRRRYDGNCRIVFLTTGREIENHVLVDTAIEQVKLGDVSSVSLRRTPIRSSLKMFSDLRNAIGIMKENNPTAVIGLGAFGSLAGVVAARVCRIPIILLEQNAVAGRANTYLSRIANVVCTSFPETQRLKAKRIVATGNPVRESIVEASQREREHHSRQLLILGGSQGSFAINDAILNLAAKSPALFDGWNVFHQAGEAQCQRVADEYRVRGIHADVKPFFDDIEQIMQGCEFVISRAGATTLAELAVMGLPAILVPDPNSIRDHQRLNAAYFAQAGAAIVVEEDNDSAKFLSRLETAFDETSSSQSRRTKMRSAMTSLARPDAASRVVDEIIAQKRS